MYYIKDFIWPILYLITLPYQLQILLSGQRAAREAQEYGDPLNRDNCAGCHIRLLSHSIKEVTRILCVPIIVLRSRPSIL